ncbi:MAG: uroporphyrinogen methyltransferase / synthase [Blastocatellia bacterium]|jgi:uroporphyrinogen III methyltransferase/synthase|nr:uroporphyrinogen methyltransferase / synthase [Blastocatellia bacterium]
MSSSTETQLTATQPLAGRTVIITRAAAQAAEFSAELERYGARVVACPTIEIAAPESYAPLDEAIENLYGYDWIIFTSVNGVDYFLKRLNEMGRDASELDDLRVCSIGEATAVRLRDAQIHVDVVPEQFKAEGVFEALTDYLGGTQGLYALNFLIPRAAVARDYLPLALEGAGARVDVVAVYRTVRPQTQERGRIEALLAGGGVDCITFTSSSTVHNFAHLFDTGDLSQLLDGVKIACIGDITASSAAEHNLRVDIQPTEYTTPALARAIAAYYAGLND